MEVVSAQILAISGVSFDLPNRPVVEPCQAPQPPFELAFLSRPKSEFQLSPNQIDGSFSAFFAIGCQSPSARSVSTPRFWNTGAGCSGTGSCSATSSNSRLLTKSHTDKRKGSNDAPTYSASSGSSCCTTETASPPCFMNSMKIWGVISTRRRRRTFLDRDPPYSGLAIRSALVGVMDAGSPQFSEKE